MARTAGAFIIVLLIVAGALYALVRHGGVSQVPWLAALVGEGGDATPAAPTPQQAGEPAKPAEPQAPVAAAAPAEPAKPAETAEATAPAAAPSTGTPAAPSTAAAPAASASPPPAAPAATAATGPAPATFDVARVEPSGDAVLAGRADPKAIVALFANGQEIARTQANENGEWVVTLEKPLAPGEYELMVVTATPDGTRQVESQERLAVSVPNVAGEAPMVALLAPDAPTKVLQQPGAAAAPTAGAPATAGRLAIATVAREEGRLTVTGSADPGAAVRVYLDDALVGEATAGADGAWTMSAAHDASVGAHRLRVDQVTPADGTVVARAEVPFDVLGAADIAAAEGSATPADATDASVAAGATAPPPETPAGATAGTDAAAAAGQTSVRIRRGDDLWSIAERLYGSGERYTAIYRANRRQIRDPNLIYPGQVFTLPN